MVQTPAERPLVPSVDHIQHMHHGTVVPGVPACLVVDEVTLLIHMHFLCLEQLGAEHRRQRDSHDGGRTANDRNDPSEFMEHDTCHTVEHGQRNEHGHEYQGCCDDRHPHLVGGIDRCLMRVLAALDVTCDILQDHDCIIDHHTDGNRQRTEGDDVQRRVG